MSTVKSRIKARRPHDCSGCGKNTIASGDFYLRWKLYPGEKGNKTRLPTTVKECGFCVARNGDDYLLHPLPDKQADAIYLYAMHNGFG